MNIDSMQNKIVIVTGATKGMGLASSLRLLELGANVVMVYCSDIVNAKQVKTKLSSYTNQMLLLQADITNVKELMC